MLIKKFPFFFYHRIMEITMYRKEGEFKDKKSSIYVVNSGMSSYNGYNNDLNQNIVKLHIKEIT